jgi:hypothetical protein
MNIAFDTLEYSEKLKAVGFSPEQAKVQAQALRDAMVEHVATKSDVDTQGERLEAKIEAQGRELESKSEAQGKRLEAKIDSEIALIRKDMNMLFFKLVGTISTIMVLSIGAFSKLAGLL